MRPRRVLLVAHSLPPEEYTGTPLTTLGYARGLAARDLDVSVLHASAQAPLPMARTTRDDGGFTRVAMPRLLDDERPDLEWSIQAAARPADAASLAEQDRILQMLDPDVVHVVNNVHLPLELAELARARGVPVVRSVTGTEDLCGRITPVSPRCGDSGSTAGVCAAPLSPLHCARCIGPDDDAERARLELLLACKRARAAHQFSEVFSAIVFPSHTFRRYFEDSLPLDPRRTRVVPMGLDLAPWGGDTIGRERPTRPPSADGEPIVFAVLGRLDEAKGTADIVTAFASSVLAGRTDWRLRFLGGGNHSLLDPIMATGNVQALGEFAPAELPGLLRDAHVGISASRFETFHRATLEYLLAGMPVIGTPVGGIPEIVTHGVNGTLLHHGDPERLAAAVVALLDDRAHLARLAEGARTTPVRSLDDELDDLLAEYERVTATVPRP
jgi:glycosyltransferase involved in cell wall biosynthesis